MIGGYWCILAVTAALGRKAAECNLDCPGHKVDNGGYNRNQEPCLDAHRDGLGLRIQHCPL